MDSYQNVRNVAMKIGLDEKAKTILARPSDAPKHERIKLYLASVGAQGGKNYCLAFLYWCYQQAAASCGMPNVLLCTGSCSDLRNWAPAQWIVKPGEPTYEGDIYLRKGHAGMVVRMNGGNQSSVRTVEGNTHTTSDEAIERAAEKGIHLEKNWGVHVRVDRNLLDYRVIRPREMMSQEMACGI